MPEEAVQAPVAEAAPVEAQEPAPAESTAPETQRSEEDVFNERLASIPHDELVKRSPAYNAQFQRTVQQHARKAREELATEASAAREMAVTAARYRGMSDAQLGQTLKDPRELENYRRVLTWEQNSSTQAQIARQQQADHTLMNLKSYLGGKDSWKDIVENWDELTKVESEGGDAFVEFIERLADRRSQRETKEISKRAEAEIEARVKDRLAQLQAQESEPVNLPGGTGGNGVPRTLQDYIAMAPADRQRIQTEQPALVNDLTRKATYRNGN